MAAPKFDKKVKFVASDWDDDFGSDWDEDSSLVSFPNSRNTRRVSGGTTLVDPNGNRQRFNPRTGQYEILEPEDEDPQMMIFAEEERRLIRQIQRTGERGGLAVAATRDAFRGLYGNQGLGGLRAWLATFFMNFRIVNPATKSDMYRLVEELSALREKRSIYQANKTQQVIDVQMAGYRNDIDGIDRQHGRVQALEDLRLEVYAADQRGEVANKYANLEHQRYMESLQAGYDHERQMKQMDHDFERDMTLVKELRRMRADNNNLEMIKGDMGARQTVKTINTIIEEFAPLMEGKSPEDQVALAPNFLRRVEAAAKLLDEQMRRLTTYEDED